jgi:hypothetical protein
MSNTSSLANNHEFGTAFLVDSEFNHMVKTFTPISERLYVIRIECRFFNYSLINMHAPTNNSEEEAKDQFYEQLEWAYAVCPSHDVKLVMGDANAKIGRETVHQPTIGKHSLHDSTNENGLILVHFAAGRQMAIKCTYFMHKWIHRQTWHSPDGHTFNQIDNWLIDGRHFSDGVDIDLPSRDEIEGALKYLKNNKAADADSIAAELLRNGGRNLVDALHAVIQQA